LYLTSNDCLQPKQMRLMCELFPERRKSTPHFVEHV
jgi:hypothetical protein